MPNSTTMIDIIAGARPNFMKIAPIIRALKNSALRYRLVHTGQHYDKKMSEDFFTQLNIPLPHENLEVGSGTQAEQTAHIMMRYEALLKKEKSNLCMVVGDVTSTMACAIVAQKECIPVAHVEGGIRSYDWTMPEEINRLVTDAITNYFFTTSEVANQNLIASGVSSENIFFVGNTMIDTLIENRPRFEEPEFFKILGLEPKNYLVATLHRPSNVDRVEDLDILVRTIAENVGEKLILFPVHPRTRATLEKLPSIPSQYRFVEPQGYLQFNYLVENSFGVITDSGGVTEETTVMGIPCITLRTSTERPETITLGTNELVGTDPKHIAQNLQIMLSGNWKKGSIPPKWDGKTGQRIVQTLETLLLDSEAKIAV